MSYQYPNRQIAVSSDPEGRNHYYIFPDNKIPDDIDEFIICGDILDSTVATNEKNSYNIRNLIEVLYNPKIISFFLIDSKQNPFLILKGQIKMFHHTCPK